MSSAVHQMDAETAYCVLCGKSMVAIVEDGRDDDCRHGPNIIAVSHLISQRRFKALMGDMMEKWL